MAIPNAKYNYCTLRISIEWTIKCPKPILPSSIPNLQTNLLLLNHNHSRDKLDSNGGVATNIKFVICIPGNDVGFAHPTLAYPTSIGTHDNYLQQRQLGVIVCYLPFHIRSFNFI